MFRKKQLSGMADARNTCLCESEVTTEVLLQLRKFVIEDDACITINNAIQLFTLGDYYGFPLLQAQVQSFLKAHISVENVSLLLPEAYRASQLTDMVFKFFSDYAPDILTFHSTNLVNEEKQVMVLVLTLVTLRVNQLELKNEPEERILRFQKAAFLYLLRWLHAQNFPPDTLIIELGEGCNFLRMDMLSQCDFSNMLIKSGMFSRTVVENVVLPLGVEIEDSSDTTSTSTSTSTSTPCTTCNNRGYVERNHRMEPCKWCGGAKCDRCGWSGECRCVGTEACTLCPQGLVTTLLSTFFKLSSRNLHS
eukprot:TRINITY_DN14081_c0_g1_i1.p1 TRINITY_DN14081_c0_g1~~TRINITY_DN14081_c0_g1_i1.p1  ORF type:complete len:307 (+),score=63.77 TRINITY_DN14081_c0_g1_i1:805-1725(+)